MRERHTATNPFYTQHRRYHSSILDIFFSGIVVWRHERSSAFSPSRPLKKNQHLERCKRNGFVRTIVIQLMDGNRIPVTIVVSAVFSTESYETEKSFTHDDSLRTRKKKKKFYPRAVDSDKPITKFYFAYSWFLIIFMANFRKCSKNW